MRGGIGGPAPRTSSLSRFPVRDAKQPSLAGAQPDHLLQGALRLRDQARQLPVLHDARHGQRHGRHAGGRRSRRHWGPPPGWPAGQDAHELAPRPTSDATAARRAPPTSVRILNGPIQPSVRDGAEREAEGPPPTDCSDLRGRGAVEVFVSGHRGPRFGIDPEVTTGCMKALFRSSSRCRADGVPNDRCDPSRILDPRLSQPRNPSAAG